MFRASIQPWTVSTNTINSMIRSACSRVLIRELHFLWKHYQTYPINSFTQKEQWDDWEKLYDFESQRQRNYTWNIFLLDPEWIHHSIWRSVSDRGVTKLGSTLALTPVQSLWSSRYRHFRVNNNPLWDKICRRLPLKPRMAATALTNEPALRYSVKKDSFSKDQLSLIHIWRCRRRG